MNDISLKLDERTVTGKKAARLINEGVVPSVVYGGKSEPMTTQSEFVATTKVVQAAGRHSPVHLTVNGKKKLAIIKSIDRDPVKHTLRHVAFHTIKQNEIITTEVPIMLVGMGESEAEKAGLIILQAIEKVEIKAKPAHLPEALEVSVKQLATTDDKITLADITLPDDVEFADAEQDLELVVANVYEPSALQAANDAAGGDAVPGDEESVEADNESGAEPGTQAEETRPGGKGQEEPKQHNVDANKD
ncbi:MAG TPA: 50S ribosomal protein L25 [Candidatus Saccharimonadales bacterium]|nr:50S ribosomal protein L25 [Candidatus Saccharimonadales bacterium]